MPVIRTYTGQKLLVSHIFTDDLVGVTAGEDLLVYVVGPGRYSSGSHSHSQFVADDAFGLDLFSDYCGDVTDMEDDVFFTEQRSSRTKIFLVPFIFELNGAFGFQHFIESFVEFQ